MALQRRIDSGVGIDIGMALSNIYGVGNISPISMSGVSNFWLLTTIIFYKLTLLLLLVV